MGTIYFILIIATLVSGALVVLRKINARSYLYGSLNEVIRHREKSAQASEQPLESRRETKYIDWYLENGHKRQNAKQSAGPASKPSAVVGVAFITNDFSQHQRASNY